MTINMEKILKSVENVETHLKQHTDYHLTTKGIVHLVINLVEEQLNER